MDHILLYVLSAFCICIHGIQHEDNSYVITTRKGQIKGLEVFVPGYENKTVYQFLKIPYASPPVGNLRFKKPKPHPNWKYTLDATKFGPSCMQIIDVYSAPFAPNKNVSEDCLFLNIYVPKTTTKEVKMSVMVWIHGGGFSTGAGMMYDGSYLAITGDVIVVSINYRLGIFGFLTTNSENAKGNYGLWDQKLALLWVKENIDSFGGDSESVTIFGQSAGGVSVSLQALIPDNRGLFNRVILESGVANSAFGISTTARAVTRIIGIHAGCNQSLSEDRFVECMRGVDPFSLLNASLTIGNDNPAELHLVLTLGPVVDFELFNDHPKHILHGNSSDAMEFFKSLDIIVGNCNQESSIILFMLPIIANTLHFDVSIGIPKSVFRDNIIKPLMDDYFSSSQRVANILCDQYCVQNNVSEQSREALELFNDFFYFAPTIDILNRHAYNNTESKRYQYVFSRKSPAPIGPARPKWYRGTGHGSEIFYLFGLRKMLQNITISQTDYHLADEMIRYWTNFAKTGDPSSGSSSHHWPQYDETEKNYQNLNGQVETKAKYKHKRVMLWLTKISKIPAPSSGLTTDYSYSTTNRKSANKAQYLHDITGYKYILISIICRISMALLLT